MTLTQRTNETLAILMRRHRKSYSELALVLGRSRGYVTDRSCGRKPWDTDDLERISIWLDEDPEQFYTGVSYQAAA